MEKNLKLRAFYLCALRKPLRVMRWSLFLFMMSMFQAQAISVLAQKTALSLNLKNSTVAEVLSEIEDNSNFYFVCNRKLVDLDRRISIQANNQPIETILSEVFKGTDVRYIMTGRQIVLTPGEDNSLWYESSAQQKSSVSGRVTGSSGSPIPGVTVVVKGSAQGVISDLDGKYSITNIPSSSTLVFSFVGMKTQEIPVAGKSVINVTMEEEIVGIEEVVAIGYGTQKKEDLSSSIATLSANELIKVPGGLEAGLQSSVPGIQITGDKIRIRGVGSINSTDPLYVVDGLIGGATPDESNIASIQILKDAASCAIYGARGANGVILITTKRGTPGAVKIDYEGYSGFKKLSHNVDILNGQQLAELINEEMYNADPTRTDYLEALSDPASIGKGYNMVDALLHTGFYQKHNMSIRGGSDNANFRINTTYTSDKDVIIKDKNENYAIQFISDFTKGKLKIGETAKINRYKRDWSNKNIIDAQRWSSTLPIYDETSSTGFGGAGNGTDGDNPLANAYLNSNNTETLTINGNVWAILEIIPGLNYKFNMGVDLTRSRTQNYESAYTVGDYQSNAEDDLTISSYQTNRFLYENTLSYDKIIGKHNISALFGVTSEETKYNYVYAFASDMPSSDILDLGTTQDSDSKDVDSSYSPSAMFSMLGRILYSYDSKYMLTANFRRDGSSKFSKSNRYGNFPSFSAAWRISQEAFMKPLKFISDLKLRGSYGVLGNCDINSFQYQSTVSFSSIWYYLNDTKVTGALPTTPSNPDVKWESQYSTDLGFDLALFDNKLSLIFDYYNKKTEDMLVNVPISYTAGFVDSSPTLNAGSIRNRGLEFNVTYKDTKGKFNYSVSANLSTVKNEVLSLGSNNEILAGTINPVGENITRTAVGHSIGQFWGYKMLGLYKTQEQLDEDASFAPNAALGDVRFKSTDGETLTAANDKTFIGNPIPKFSYGFSTDASYDLGRSGVVDLSMIWQGCYGNDIYNNSRYWGEGMYHYYNDFSSTLDRYRAEELVFTNPVSGVTTVYPKNTDTNIPRAVLGDPNQNLRASSRFIENGSYLRLKSLTIGYTLPKSLLDKFKIDLLRFYVGGKNLLTVTKYSGYDPEVASDNSSDSGRYNLNRGIDAPTPWGVTFPNTKEVFFGLQCTF